MSRKKAREITMIKLYQMEIHQLFEPEPLLEREFAHQISDGREVKYATHLVEKFIKNQEEIDSLIKQFSEKWDLKRISKIDLSIIRLAITEMLFDESIPESVSINEAVSLSRKFSDEDAYKFVNGILGNISRRAQ
jgi:N utilization substance protein B